MYMHNHTTRYRCIDIDIYASIYGLLCMFVCACVIFFSILLQRGFNPLLDKRCIVSSAADYNQGTECFLFISSL